MSFIFQRDREVNGLDGKQGVWSVKGSSGFISQRDREVKGRDGRLGGKELILFICNQSGSNSIIMSRRKITTPAVNSYNSE